jgi:Outer membrane protein beta-barrel domain
MRTIGKTILTIAAAAAGCAAQQWEFGGSAGAGFLNTVSVATPLAAATAGFQTGYSFGAYLGQNLHSHFSGELHYAYLQSNLKLASGGTSVSFNGMSNVIHYDFLWHTNRPSRLQFFVAVGGGVKIFDGTGHEEAYQPLSQFGYFTKTRSFEPMGDFGAGVRYALTPRLSLRTEFRDYITPFPTQVLTPAPGAKFGDLLHDLVPTVSIAYQF